MSQRSVDSPTTTHDSRHAGGTSTAPDAVLRRSLGNDHLRSTDPDREPSAARNPDRSASGGCGMGSCGGCAVGRIQLKLMAGPVDDEYERAADKAADEVMSGEGRRPVLSRLRDPQPLDPPLQRACHGCGPTGHGRLDDESEERVQRRADTPDPSLTSGGPIAESAQAEISALRGGGAPLAAADRTYFETGFGSDFSQIRVHTGAQAGAATRAIGARAFTSGHDVVFGDAEYQPGTASGRWLIAHELAHTLQQSEMPGYLQRLTITRHTLTSGACGERNVEWVFSLDAAAPADGYIVQQVENFEFVRACPEPAIGPSGPIGKFWEAWPVRQGAKVDWTTVRDRWTDGSTRPGRPGRNGRDVAVGTVKFFTKAVTGDLGDFNVAPADPSSAWGPGKVRTSGALPSTPTEPSWWSKKPTEGPATRSASSEWDCCGTDASKHMSTVKATP
ncbi:DUF4157 domain-containing protein [Nocardia sp. NPDC050710]|uniref:eCIS core domain-containing protein n=1 Tax=Nocardia sp. NPDC050710 TaxID=3157220 RepID=UPI0033DC7CBB